MNKPISLILRYITIIILGLGNLYLIYKLFTPLTLYTTYFILNIFTKPTLFENFIIINNTAIELIPACIAGSAYYLLLILNLSTPNIKTKKRINLTILTITFLFIFNILRIIILYLVNKTIYFESLHLIFWYVLSTLAVILIWIYSTRKLKIKSIPIYSDFKYLIKNIRQAKQTKITKKIRKRTKK